MNEAFKETSYRESKQMNATPPALVSVVIGVYNGARFLHETLASILAQTYGHLEIIIVDDYSTDDTPALIRAISASDVRVVSVRMDKNSGVAAARNRGIQLSRGDFLAPCDADDLWEPTKIARQVALGMNRPSVGMIYCWTAHIDISGRFTGEVRTRAASGFVLREMLRDDLVGSGSIPLFRRNCLVEIGGYDESLTNLEDHDLCLRVAERWEVDYVPEILAKYRQVSGSKSRRSAGMVASFERISGRLRARHPELSRFEWGRYRGKHFWWFSSLNLQMNQYRTAWHHLARSLVDYPGLLLRTKTYGYLLLVLIGCLTGASFCDSLRQKCRKLTSSLARFSSMRFSKTPQS